MLDIGYVSTEGKLVAVHDIWRVCTINRMSETQSNLPSNSFSLMASDGLPLVGRRWDPTGTAIANVGIIHGLGEHSGRYDELAQRLNRAGYRVVTFDHRGHGLTAGKRGHVADYSLLLDDIECMVAELSNAGPPLPGFLFGHSLGGNLALSYMLRRQPRTIAGLVITSPLLEPTTNPPILKRGAARVLNYVWPSFTFDTGITAAKLSHDPDALTRDESDPLVHHRVSARLAIQMLAAGRWLLDHASELKTPLLLLHGDEDPVTSPMATRKFAERVKTPCELYISAHDYHELHRESDREATFQRIVAWLDARGARV